MEAKLVRQRELINPTYMKLPGIQMDQLMLRHENSLIFSQLFWKSTDFHKFLGFSSMGTT